MNYSIKQIKSLSKEFGTSFYIFNKDTFVKNFINFKKELTHYYPKSEVAYAYKSNYMPILGDLIHQNGGMIEVVSDLEYNIALKSIHPSRIIYNGPVKTKQDIKIALLNNSLLHIDSIYELNFIKELLNKKEIDKAKIGIRVNFNVLHYGSRFGFNIENNEFENCIAKIEDDNRIELISIHSHFSTREKSLEIFSIRVKKMCDIYKKLSISHNIEYIDIGGGFFGIMPEELSSKFNVIIPNYKEYAYEISHTILQELKDYKLPRLIIEPGISIVGNSMDFFTQILEIKKANNINYAVCNTSINVINPTKSNIDPFFMILNDTQSVNELYKIVGNTCMEHDIIIDDFYGKCNVGDFICFKNRGAYSNVYTSNFIMASPPILSLEGDVYKHRDTEDSILNVYNYKNKGIK